MCKNDATEVPGSRQGREFQACPGLESLGEQAIDSVRRISEATLRLQEENAARKAAAPPSNGMDFIDAADFKPMIPLSRTTESLERKIRLLEQLNRSLELLRGHMVMSRSGKEPLSCDLAESAIINEIARVCAA